MWDLPCGPITHKYLRRWATWSRVAEIQAERAHQRKRNAAQKQRAGTTRRKR